jgi:hypothetical protein
MLTCLHKCKHVFYACSHIGRLCLVIATRDKLRLAIDDLQNATNVVGAVNCWFCDHNYFFYGDTKLGVYPPPDFNKDGATHFNQRYYMLL